MPKIYPALGLSLVTLATSLLLGACDNANNTNTTTDTNPGNTTAGNTTDSSQGLKIGSLLPATGDLASIGQQMSGSVPLLVETVNACEGVNGKPVTLVEVDDQTDHRAGAAGMTKLATLDKVAGVVGSFASSVSTAAV